MLHDYADGGIGDYRTLASPSIHNTQVSPSPLLDVDTSVIHKCITSSQATQQRVCASTVALSSTPEDDLTGEDDDVPNEIPQSPVKEPRYAPRVNRPDIGSLTLLQAVALNASYCGSCISTTAHMTSEQVSRLEPIEHLVMSFHLQTSVATHAFKDTCVYEHMTTISTTYTVSDVLHSSGILQSAVMPHALCANGEAIW